MNRIPYLFILLLMLFSVSRPSMGESHELYVNSDLNLSGTMQALEFSIELPLESYNKIKKGHFPLQMDDRWKIEFNEPYLLFSRSWTDHLIYMCRVKLGSSSVIIDQCMVQAEHLNQPDINSFDHGSILRALIGQNFA